jgi:hypothetical protein
MYTGFWWRTLKIKTPHGKLGLEDYIKMILKETGIAGGGGGCGLD